MLITFIIAAILILLIALFFFLPDYLTEKQIRRMPGNARVTGSCHDTMDIGLRFEEERLTYTRQWTDGCDYSHLCLKAAADLSKGKTPEEISQITPSEIIREVNGLPQDHLHCASLATKTMRSAAADYMDKNKES